MNTGLTVLAVDRNRHNLDLLAQVLGTVSYGVRQASSLDELDELLATGERFHVALIDLSGFDARIWERCQQLRVRDVPFLVVSAHQHPSLQSTSLSYGAQGVLVKPLSIRQLLGLIRALLEG